MTKSTPIAESALSLISDAIIATDAQGLIRYVNSGAEQLTGAPAHELLGRELAQLLRPADPAAADLLLTHDEHPGERRQDTALLQTADEEREVTVESIGMNDEGGDAAGRVLLLRDQPNEAHLAERLRHQSAHDDLTGLLNRREFERRAEVLIEDAASSLRTHALLYLDLDQFKLINDTCGHLAGDEMLRQVGLFLQEQVQHGDIVGRLGGDEFGILLCGVTGREAIAVANRLRIEIEKIRFSWRSANFAISASIGVTQLTEFTGNLTAALSQVDIACYAAKDSGRNHVHLYRSDDKEMAQRHGEMHWPARINWAIEDDRLCLAAQKIVPLQDDGKPTLAEMLLRIRSPEGELISPGAFIPAAERYSLMPVLDRWTISHVLEILGRGEELSVRADRYSINLSGVSIGDPEFLRFIIEAFRRTGVDPCRICFEVTETAAVTSFAKAVRFMSLLREIGCTFALDDFGAGMSSFGYLKRLPLDYLKIDGLFVRDLNLDPFHRAIVKSITEVDRAAGLLTIAEFVEDEATLDRLRELGVDYGQGFHIHKPELLPFDEPDKSAGEAAKILRA